MLPFFYQLKKALYEYVAVCCLLKIPLFGDFNACYLLKVALFEYVTACCLLNIAVPWNLTVAIHSMGKCPHIIH